MLSFKPSSLLYLLLFSPDRVEGFMPKLAVGKSNYSLKTHTELMMQKSKQVLKVERTKSNYKMPILGSMLFIVSTSLLLPVPARAFFIDTITTIDPYVEAEIFTDISHLTLDIASFVVPSQKLITGLFGIIGRIFSMVADYVPDHTILPEEFLFQIFMLTIASFGMVKASLLPMYGAAAESVNIKDGKAYKLLFAPAGVTWNQFKALSVCAIEWITIEYGESMQFDKDEEYMYWLFDGSVQVDSDYLPTYFLSRSSRNDSKNTTAARALLGERRLWHRFRRSSSYLDSGLNATAIKTTQLLRIHTPSLIMLMDSDHTFAESMQALVFQGIEAKLDALQQSDNNDVNQVEKKLQA